MVRTYDLISKLEKLDYFSDLLKAGIIPMTLIDYKVIFEFYERERRTNKNRQAIANTAEEFNVCERYVYSVVKKMK